MEPVKQGVTRRFVMVLLGHALLLVCFSFALAQTANLTVNPNAVGDPAKPGPVTVRVTKSDGSAVDAGFNDQVGAVQVGGVDVAFKPGTAPGEITLTPHPNLKGAQKVELFNKTGQSLGTTQLQYAETTA